ncbi:MAG: hypothetical protein RJA61_707 [Candidatus Parcubacteria bacterium]|jgi:hypothetical protein
MKTLITLALIVAGTLAGIGYYVTEYGDLEGLKTYSSDTYGISFKYPKTYFLTEKLQVGSGERYHYTVMLVEDTEFNRKLLAGEIKEPTEGPVAITFDVYQNNLDKQSLLGWMNNSSASNFKLSDGTHSLVTVSGKEAVKYTWDGLYQGDTIAFLSGDNIIASSVTYMAPEDQIRKDFEEVLKTVRVK